LGGQNVGRNLQDCRCAQRRGERRALSPAIEGATAHWVERNFALLGGAIHPNAAPKFGRTPAPRPGDELVRDSGLKLKDWGLAAAEVE
jgi:hypothetical protein